MLDRDVIRTVASLLPQMELSSILKIDESFDMLKFIKSVALNEISKTFEKGKMLNLQLGSIPTMDLNKMLEFQKHQCVKLTYVRYETSIVKQIYPLED